MATVQFSSSRFVAPFDDPLLKYRVGTLDVFGGSSRLLGGASTTLEPVASELVLLDEQAHCLKVTERGKTLNWMNE